MATVSGASLRRAADAGTTALARRFGDVLRVGDGAAAELVIDDALATGLAPPAVQSLVIEPAMVRIGELWESRAISVADEHLATSISQRALIGLFAVLSARGVRARSRERVLLAAVEGQQHVLGLRMVADVLEGAGFDVLYLGADLPVESLGTAVAQYRPAVVGLSYGIAAGGTGLAESLWAVHRLGAETRVMLGGHAIPSGFRTVGYPCVENSMEVVGAVEALLAGPPQQLPEVIEALRSDGGARREPREHPVEADPIAERLAKVAEQAGDIARSHVRRAETYRDLALRDPLTELANRRGFEEELAEMVGSPGTAGALLMIDIDRFKAVNDAHGHQAGDRLLRAVAQAISGALRPGDTAARVGGDEFAILLPGAPAAVAAQLGDRIRAAVARAAEPRVSVSIGAAVLSGDSRRAMLAADTALYGAKAEGRDRVVAAHG